MNKLSQIVGADFSPVSAPAYTMRTTDCEICDGNGLVGCDWSDGFPDTQACDCITGEVDAACTDCGLVKPLNDEGVCERCHDAGELPVALFELKYPSGWQLAEQAAFGMGGKL